MRILILNYEFPPLGGGAGNATYYLLKDLAAKNDITVDLVTSSTDKYRFEKFSDNINIHYLDIDKSKNLLHQTNKELLVYSLKAYWFSKKLIKKNKYDLCHAFFGIPCGYLAKKLKLPYVVSLRGADVPGHTAKYSFHYKFLSPLIRKVWGKARFVIANSEDLKNEAVNFMDLPYKIIFNGVDVDKYKPGMKEDNVFRILYIGRLQAIKNLDLLIKSFAGFIKERPDIDSELLLIGDGHEKESLMKLANDLNIADKVKFIGHQAKDKIVNFYHQSSVFVLLSDREGMSNSLLEATACGLPVIATDTGGNRKIIKDQRFVVGKDQRQIIDRLNLLNDDANLAGIISGQNRQAALAMSWPSSSEKYFQLYKEAVSI